MAKHKKKRNKTYAGADASATPTVTRISAVHRHPVQQWWFEKKRIAKPVIITVVIATVVIWLLVELVRAIVT